MLTHTATPPGPVPHHDAAGVCPSLLPVVPGSGIENPALCRSFSHSFCFFSVSAKLSMRIIPSGQAAKTNLYAGKDSSRLRGGTFTVAFSCTLLSSGVRACAIYCRCFFGALPTGVRRAGRKEKAYKIQATRRRASSRAVLCLLSHQLI